MYTRLGVLPLLCLVLASVAVAQAPPSKPAPEKADQSQEAVVFEYFSHTLRYENDGTFLREDSSRVRIQSEAGVQQYGLLNFSYASGTGTFEIDYVRVHKPDGTVVETPQEDIQDMAAQITREAPFYSDLHEKHVAVKGLSVGDVLEYKVQEHTTKPLAPGQFWTAYNFTHDQVILDEQLEISVPRDRKVKLKSASLQPVITESGAYRIYTWHSKNLQHNDETDKKRKAVADAWKQARGRLAQPDVLLSSFASWEEVGHWYGSLQEERVKPTPEVAAKAAELTKNDKDDEAKLRTLYAYVSTQFRYIGIAFGIGRYQPHSAATVLENQYGDCKDKHTLLASLLSAAGIPAYPALISSSHAVDAAVPSPGQFDHVITVVPRPGGLVWLDTTPEVGPFQYLLPALRDKQALVIWKDKAPELIQTPTTLPYKTVQTFNMDATLSEAGTLEGSADFSARGDLEYVLRAAFRAVPLPQWKDLGQRISYSFGFGGDVSEVNASSPEKTDQPFHFSYKYTRKDFGDWPNHRIVAPEPAITLPTNDEEMLPSGPTWLGAPSDIQFHSQLELPKGYHPEIPAAIHLKEDFAQYDATYEFKDGKLISERHLQSFMSEVPAGEREQFKKFVKAVQDDYGAFISLSSRSALAADPRDPTASALTVLRSLPDSSNEEAMGLEDDARDSITNRNMPGAVSSLYRAVAVDPQFTRAWVLLGGLLISGKKIDAGKEAFHKAMATDPNRSEIPKTLGWMLMGEAQFVDAVPVWQDYEKAHPDDIDGPANLGNCLMKLKRYSEAADAYEAAVKISDRPDLQASLGSAYLQAGSREKAAEAFGKLPDISGGQDYLNDVAYQMANADLNLPNALEYAKRAVRRVEEESQKITLANLTPEDLDKTVSLAAYWDTLGWIDERTSDMNEAEMYLKSAWKLSQDGVVAGHLCHLYRRTHQAAAAIQMCRLSIHRIQISGKMGLSDYQTELAAAEENLKYLTGGVATSNKADDSAGIVNRERTFKLPRFLIGTESAEFFVLLTSDGKSKTFKVADTKFISGSDKMKLHEKQLKSIDFNFRAPDDSPARFVRRGILGCYQYTGCSFVLLDPASVHSID